MFRILHPSSVAYYKIQVEPLGHRCVHTFDKRTKTVVKMKKVKSLVKCQSAGPAYLK